MARHTANMSDITLRQIAFLQQIGNLPASMSAALDELIREALTRRCANMQQIGTDLQQIDADMQQICTPSLSISNTKSSNNINTLTTPCRIDADLHTSASDLQIPAQPTPAALALAERMGQDIQQLAQQGVAIGQGWRRTPVQVARSIDTSGADVEQLGRAWQWAINDAFWQPNIVQQASYCKQPARWATLLNQWRSRIQREGGYIAPVKPPPEPLPPPPAWVSNMPKGALVGDYDVIIGNYTMSPDVAMRWYADSPRDDMPPEAELIQNTLTPREMVAAISAKARTNDGIVHRIHHASPADGGCTAEYDASGESESMLAGRVSQPAPESTEAK